MFFYICFKACTRNGVVNFSVIKFISDNEGLDQLIPYRGVYKGKKVYMNFFLVPKT